MIRSFIRGVLTSIIWMLALMMIVLMVPVLAMYTLIRPKKTRPKEKIPRMELENISPEEIDEFKASVDGALMLEDLRREGERTENDEP